MRLEQDRMGQIKNWIYIGSSVILFITWCLSLAALAQGGGSDGHIAWVFGLCFLTIPLVVYQSLTPIWSRTARFSNPHAHCAVDGVLVLLWFSAWASLASYVVRGKGQGKSTTATGCENFAFGSAAKCNISQADIFFAVFMMLCFVATAFFSFKVLMEYRRTGIAPTSAHMFRGNSKVAKEDISYPQHQKPGFETHEEEAFDPRMDTDTGYQGHDGRDAGYSFEATRVHGGAPGSVPYEGAYGGYASLPANSGEDGRYVQHERATSFGGPLGGSRI